MKITLHRLALSLVVLVLLTSCKPQPDIAATDRPRSGQPRQPLDADAFAARLDHMLVAIVPHDEQAWFFKLDGPAPRIDEVRDGFLQFLATVDFSLDAEGAEEAVADQPSADQQGAAGETADGQVRRPFWELPAGWEEQAGDAMTLSVVTVPTSADPLKMTVTVLPMAGEWPDFVQRNVNRWLGQLDEGPVDQATINQWTRTQATASGKATWLELAGRRQAGRMPPGHPPVRGADGAASAAGGESVAATSSNDPQSGRGASDRPEASPPASEPRKASTSELSYVIPAGWTEGRSGGMRKATLTLGAGEAAAELAVTAFPGERGVGMGSLPMNLGRWAGQVGAAAGPDDVEALEQAATEISVDGVDGHYMELMGPADGQSPRGMLVAMVYREQMVWFFKFSGPAESIKAGRDAFREFLQSVDFTNGGS